MSCSTYCQGLQSCLEPARLVEPRVLRLKLAPQKSNTSRSSSPRSNLSFIPDSGCDSKSHIADNVDTGGWSFLQFLATKQEDEVASIEKKVYVPPNFKRSSSMLSDKSLEMCTESLGSETGSDGSENRDAMAPFCLENEQSYETRSRPKLRDAARKMTRTASFPPPLTSNSGSVNFQVRSHREGGRLVLEAVNVSSCQAYFQAERMDGRLRLHLMKDCFASNGDEHEDDETLIREEDSEDDGNWEDENGNENCEMGMKNLAMPSRCKENESGGNSLINWEPFWVAI